MKLASKYAGLLFGHPLRLAVFMRLVEHGEASPKELSAHFGAEPPMLAYHVRTLAALGLIELVREEPRRGSIEHFYVATTTAEKVLQTLMAEARSRLAPWYAQPNRREGIPRCDQRAQ